EAQAAMQKPDLLAKDPVEKLRVETLARGTAPDHVIRSFFYSAASLMEAGRFGYARERLQPCSKGPMTYALAPEALSRLRARQAAEETPAAGQRYGEILLELAEAQMQFDRARDAAQTCELIAEKSLLPQRAEEVQHRLAAAWHLAGDYDQSDAACRRFLSA